MVKIPLTNSPNQTFACSVPINGVNRRFKFNLWFNYQANYWLFSLYDVANESWIFLNLPLLVYKGSEWNIIHQLDYMKIGICIMLPEVADKVGHPTENNIGTDYIMIWGDNDNV